MLERRRFKRLPIELEVSCLKVGDAADKFYMGCTANVSPGGVYFETSVDSFKAGNLLNVELSIPPTTGLLELGGKISGFGRVLRICEIKGDSRKTTLNSAKYGLAVEFCQAPKLT